MQTSVQDVRSQTSTITNPLALWHLLSLDAPTVAALWTWFVARAMHATLAPAIPVAMFLAVWLLYATDRLLDGRRADREPLEARHLFHQEHRRGFTAAIVLVSLGLIPMLYEIPREILRGYCLLAALLLGWFILIHVTARKKILPKEIVPGPFFAAAVFLPTLRASVIPEAAAFALLCALNCLCIHAWEHEETYRGSHLTTRFGTHFLRPIALVTIAFPLALIATAAADLTPVLLAISLAGALLLVLHRVHDRLEPTNLRAAADMVLLTPLLIAPFVR